VGERRRDPVPGLLAPGLLTGLLSCLLASGLVAPGTPAAASGERTPPATVRSSVRPCSSGLVALTFDDGPSSSVTPSLLTLLSKRRVPATFFVVGGRVAAAPALVRRAARDGHVIGNHTYGHENLTRLSDAGIRSTLGRTTSAIRNAGVRPSRLMRPPYGAINSRVRSVVAGLGLTPVLWDVDTRDWQSGSSADIAARVLGAIHPHTSNIVLMHDGVARSPITLQAVPTIITKARARGYCFATLGPNGRPAPPVPVVRVGDSSVREGDPGSATRMRFALRLDRPTTRRVSVRVRTVAGSARAGSDYVSVDRRVFFPVGTVNRTVVVRVRGDRMDEPAERFRLRLRQARGLKLGRAVATGLIRDNDPTPRLRLEGSTVTEPTNGSVSTTVTLRLDRPRSTPIKVHLVTQPGTADETDYTPLDTTVSLPAGTRTRIVPVEVLADEIDEPEEAFTVVATAKGAVVVGNPATIVVLPPSGVPARS
jgi:peptidoglycan-N-acetylglucosamine deacetylase